MNNYYVYWIHKEHHTDPYSQGYVGISNDPVRRFKEHSNNKQKSYVANAIKSGATMSVLHENIDKVSAKSIEETYRPKENIGWNVAKGGGMPPLGSWDKVNSCPENRIKATEALLKRQRESGYTEAELHNIESARIRAKTGLHKTPHTTETKKLISEKNKERFKDISNHPMYGRTAYKLTSPTGEIFFVKEGFKQWCLDNGLHASNIRKVALGERKHCCGWKAEFFND